MRTALLLAACAGLAQSAAALPFTGDVPTDFPAGPAILLVVDPVGDVAVPGDAPLGTVSGWDLAGLRASLDRDNARLQVGLDFQGIAGDADGDGIESGTAPWLAGLFGVDWPALAESESICLAFDMDLDGQYDVIAGVPETDGTYRVCQYQSGVSRPSAAFGVPLPAHQGPWALGPDMEISLEEVDNWLDLSASDVCVNVRAFAGSLDDDGIGEDNLATRLCFHEETVEAQTLPVRPDLLRAFPNPFNPLTTLAVDLARTSNVKLSVYNLNGQMVQTLVDGKLEAGHHEIAFNAASLPSGLYLARLSTVSGEQVTRLLLTK